MCKIDYSNVIYTGNGDVDGTTLFAFGNAPPSVSMTADDPGDPDEFQEVTSKVHAKVNHLPSGHFAADLTATWTWPVVSVTHSDTVDGSFTTDGVDTALFSVTGDNSDPVSPTATFVGEFDLSGFYEVEVQANVKYHDSRTGEDLGPYGPGDVYLGDPDDEPSAGSAATSSKTASIDGLEPNQTSGPPPPTIHPKVRAARVAGYIGIDGLKDPNDPGGLVVLNQDGNGAQRQMISVSAIASPSWLSYPNYLHNSVKILRNNSKVDIYTQAVGGSPMVFDGTSNVIPATRLPLTLYVGGTSYSTTMRDVTLTAQAITNGKSAEVGQALFTVLWVDNVTVRLNTDGNGSKFSPDNNDAPANYFTNYGSSNIGANQVLGNTPANSISLYGWVYEAKGRVHPSNFDYSYTGTGNPDDPRDPNYNRLHLARDVQAHFYYNKDALQSDISKEWNSQSPGPNDTSAFIYQSRKPSLLGNIYDIDGPGIDASLANWPNGEVRRLRFNAREYAEILAQGKLTRCSTITGFYLRFSATQFNGGFQPSNDLPNDNLSGSGTTTVTP